MRHVFVMKSILAMVWRYGVDEGRFFLGAFRSTVERRQVYFDQGFIFLAGWPPTPKVK